MSQPAGTRCAALALALALLPVAGALPPEALAHEAPRAPGSLAAAVAGLGSPLARDLAARALSGDERGLLELLAPPRDAGAAGAVAYGARLLAQGTPAPARFAPAPFPDLLPGDAHPLAGAVAAAYAAYGLPPPTRGEAAAMQALEQGLDPGVARAAAALLLALAAHAEVQREAGARLGDEGRARLQQLAEAPGRSAAGRAEALALLEGMGLPRVLGSAARIARGVDALAEALRAAPAAADGGGWVFRDPVGLVLVGDAGPNLYDGNTAGLPAFAPFTNLLTVDLGGDDLYTNNAGGAGAGIPSCVVPLLAVPLGCGNGVAAAATIDLAGDDVYLADRQALGNVAVQLMQGAAMDGVGVLRDLEGNDTYTAYAEAPRQNNQLVQGSGLLGVGVLVDDAGDDRYNATERNHDFSRQWAQGASAFFGGVGVLLDRGGHDHYLQATEGVAKFNQYGQGVGDLAAGAGALLDLEGDDRYEARQVITEDPPRDGDLWAQGMGLDGVGVLVDLAGRDAYLGHQDVEMWSVLEVQGVSDTGVGVLLDARGDDAYRAFSRAQMPATVFAQGTAGRGVGGAGLGLLADLEGHDTYLLEQRAEGEAELGGQGMADLAGLGLLYDGGGSDVRVADQASLGAARQWVQGAARAGAGVLWDEDGDDVALALQAAAGGASQLAQGAGEGGVGVLLDRRGHDTYTAVQAGAGEARQRAQGSAYRGAGALLDLAGDDAYATAGAGADRQAQGASDCGPGLLLDLAGSDAYTGSPGADGTMWWADRLGGLGLDLPASGAPPLALPATPLRAPQCDGGTARCLLLTGPLPTEALLALPPCVPAGPCTTLLAEPFLAVCPPSPNPPPPPPLPPLPP